LLAHHTLIQRFPSHSAVQPDASVPAPSFKQPHLQPHNTVLNPLPRKILKNNQQKGSTSSSDVIFYRWTVLRAKNSLPISWCNVPWFSFTVMASALWATTTQTVAFPLLRRLLLQHGRNA